MEIKKLKNKFLNELELFKRDNKVSKTEGIKLVLKDFIKKDYFERGQVLPVKLIADLSNISEISANFILMQLENDQVVKKEGKQYKVISTKPKGKPISISEVANKKGFHVKSDILTLKEISFDSNSEYASYWKKLELTEDTKIINVIRIRFFKPFKDYTIKPPEPLIFEHAFINAELCPEFKEFYNKGENYSVSFFDFYKSHKEDPFKSEFTISGEFLDKEIQAQLAKNINFYNLYRQYFENINFLKLESLTYDSSGRIIEFSCNYFHPFIKITSVKEFDVSLSVS